MLDREGQRNGTRAELSERSSNDEVKLDKDYRSWGRFTSKRGLQLYSRERRKGNCGFALSVIRRRSVPAKCNLAQVALRAAAIDGLTHNATTRRFGKTYCCSSLQPCTFIGSRNYAETPIRSTATLLYLTVMLSPLTDWMADHDHNLPCFTSRLDISFAFRW